MAKIVYLTTADVSPWTVPADWTSSNTIEVIGGGAGTPAGGSGGGGGGGGGAYSKIDGLVLTPGGTAAFSIGGGGTGAGGDTWFNGATLALSSVGAKGGNVPSGVTGGAGGSALGAVGTTHYSGGSGGSNTGGGGGAAGPHGDGFPGNDGTGTTGGDGGDGDDGFTPGGGGADSAPAVAGSQGTQFNATHGSGGGGGGSRTSTGGSGGLYGGGAGNGGDAGGLGRAGLIVITYQTVSELAGGWNINTSIPARFGRNNIHAGSGSTFAAVASTTSSVRNWTAQVDYRYAKRFPVTEQQFTGYQPQGIVPTGPTPASVVAWQGDFGYKFGKRYPVTATPFLGMFTQGSTASAPSLYWGYDAWNVALLPIPVTEHEFSVLPFQIQPTVPKPQGWQGDFGYQFKKPLSPALQQFIATRIDLPGGKDTIAFGLSANDVVLLPFEACYQQFASIPFQSSIPTVVPDGVIGWQGDFGFQFTKPFPVTQQPLIGYTPQGVIPTTAPDGVIGWQGDIGVARVKPFPVVEQSLVGYTPQGAIASVPTPAGGFNVTPTYAFKKPTPVTEHQFSSLSLTPPPTAETPQGWQTQFDVKFAKRTPVYLNPFIGFFSAGAIPTKVVKYGWWGYQPVISAKPFSVALQQFSFFQPAGYINPIPPDQVLPPADPYIYPGDKKAKAEREKILGPYDPRKLSRKQRKLIAQLEARRWEELTAGPTREQKLHEDMQAAIQEVLAKAEKKRIEDAKVGGLFAAPPAVGLEASLHAAIRVVKELEAQQALDDARKAIARRKQEAIEQAEREAREAEERTQQAARAARKAKKAAQDAKLLAKYRMKKRMEAEEIHDAVFDIDKPRRIGKIEREEILDAVIDVARRRK